MKCRMFCALLATLSLAFAAAPTHAATVTLSANGSVTDNGTGDSGSVPLEGHIDFVVLSASSSQQDSSFDGSAGKPIATVRDWIIAIAKMLADMPCSSDPPPDDSGEPQTLAAITNQTYQGVFDAVAPDFQASGSYSRTPTSFEFDYELTVGSEMPELTGFYSFQTDTLPAGLGAAEQSAVIIAETVTGVGYEFTQDASLTFDPTVELSMPQLSVGSETITIGAADVSYSGTAKVTMVPEPSSFFLLTTVVGGILICVRRHRRMNVNVCLMFLLMFMIAPRLAHASTVALNASGQITENGSGSVGQATLNGSVDFSVSSTSSTSQGSSYEGQATQDMDITLREVYERAWMLVKDILNYEISTSPPPADGGPETLAAVTGETFDGSFLTTTPDFQFSGSFSRTPAEMLINYELTLEPTCPDLTGYHTMEAHTKPNGPGSALRTIEISAEMAGGGFYQFTHDTVLSFDPSVELSAPEMAVGEELIIRDGNLFTFSGSTTVVIPEPSAVIMLCMGAFGLLLHVRRTR